MPELEGFPYFEIEFDTLGNVVDSASVSNLMTALDVKIHGGALDLVIISHGWNNNMAQARSLYKRFFATMRAQLGAVPRAADRSYFVAAVLWPSKRFTPEELIPGGIAAVADASGTAMSASIGRLKDTFSDPDAKRKLDEVERLTRLLHDQSNQDRIVTLFVDLLPRVGRETDEGIDAEISMLSHIRGRDVLRRLGELSAEDDAIVIAGGGTANVLDDAAASVKNAVLRLINLITYYTMKERAGLVGRSGLYPILRRIRRRYPELRIHLIGHSFGARLVTAAADGIPGEPPIPIATLLLLQAAYSHFGLADKWDGTHDGLYADVVRVPKVTGSILVTHSNRDWEVGYAYPIASRIRNQVAQGIGGPDDRFGGMGRNGALKCGAIDVQLGAAGPSYRFDHKVINLNGDSIIESHGDVAKPEIAVAFLSAIRV